RFVAAAHADAQVGDDGVAAIREDLRLRARLEHSGDPGMNAEQRDNERGRATPATEMACDLPQRRWSDSVAAELGRLENAKKSCVSQFLDGFGRQLRIAVGIAGSLAQCRNHGLGPRNELCRGWRRSVRPERVLIHGAESPLSPNNQLATQ